jgi:2-phosphosulfolactate phosphatase
MIWIVASGWEGSFSLEDTACAGAVIDGLIARGDLSLADIAGNDEAIAAVTLYRQYQDNLVDLLTHASHGKRLLRLGLFEDLKYCAQIDVLDVVPFQQELGVLKLYAGVPTPVSA